MLIKFQQKKIITTLALVLGLGVSQLLISSCSQEQAATAAEAHHSAIRLNINSAFLKEQPLHNNVQYALAITDDKNNVLATQVINCKNIKECSIVLDEWHPPQTELGYVRLFNNRGGLVAASLVELRDSKLKSGAATSLDVQFSEVTTGNYVMTRLDQVADVLLSGFNGDVTTDLNNFIGMPFSYAPEITTPGATYSLAKSLGMEQSETAAILRLWYNIYGPKSEAEDDDSADNSASCYAPKAMAKRAGLPHSHCPAHFINVEQIQPTLSFNYRAPLDELMDQIRLAIQGDDVASGFASLRSEGLKKGDNEQGAATKPVLMQNEWVHNYLLG